MRALKSRWAVRTCARCGTRKLSSRLPPRSRSAQLSERDELAHSHSHEGKSSRSFERAITVARRRRRRRRQALNKHYRVHVNNIMQPCSRSFVCCSTFKQSAQRDCVHILSCRSNRHRRKFAAADAILPATREIDRDLIHSLKWWMKLKHTHTFSN